MVYKKLVVNFYKNKDGYKISDILRIYNISNGSLYNWVKCDKTNSLKEKASYNKTSKYTPAIKCYIRSYVLKRKVFDYNKLIKLIQKKYNIKASKTSIYDILKCMDLTRKRIHKKYLYGNQLLHKEKLEKFKSQIKSIKRDDIISIDETSIDTRMLPLYGWNVKGKKLEMKVNALKKRYTLICAISNKRIIQYKIINGSANAEHFKDFLMDLTKTVENKYLLMDNARIHHSKLVKEYVSNTSNKQLFNVPYMPQYNPIEHIFSILKDHIRKIKINGNGNKLKNGMEHKLKKISKKIINNCFIKSLTI
jgi:transposase